MKLSKWVVWTACSMMACLFVSDIVSAQPPGGRGRGGRGGGQVIARYQLATLPEVQTELKLNDDQKKAAADATAKQTEEQGNLRGGGLSFQEQQAKLATVRNELTTKFVGSLDDTQKTRLHGLFIQANPNAKGPVLQDPMIAAALNLTDDQKKAIEKSVADTQAAVVGAQGDPEAMTKARTEGDAALDKILNDDQKKKLTELKGKELTMDTTSLRGGRGGRGGAGGGRGRRGAN